MPPSDHVAPAAQAAATRDAEAPLARALQALYLAYQKTSIYPPGHPAVPEAVCRAGAAFREALVGRESLTLRVVRDRLHDGDVELVDASGSVRCLALMLHDLEVASLELRAGVDEDEIERLARVLGRARTEGVSGAGLVALLESDDEPREDPDSEIDAPHPHVVLTAIDYDALTFDDGARTDEPTADDSEVWSRLSRTLLEHDAPCADDVDATTLADEIGREMAGDEGAALGVLRSRMRRLDREMRGLSQGQRAAIRRRMAQFVSALNPRLRYDLLRVDPKGPGDGLDFLGDVADVVPETDLLDALQAIDRLGGRVPGELMTLMNKLVRISRSRPTLASGLRDTLTRWGVHNTGLTPDEGDLRAALEELFQRRAKFQANPEPYAHLLDDLARRTLDGVSCDAYRDRYRDPRDPEDVRLHAAELAVRLLGNTRGGHFRAGVFGYVSTVTSQLIDRGRFELLQDAAVAARACASLRREPENARLAAAGFLGEFATAHRIGRILGRVRRTGEVTEAVINLLHLGGAQATDAVVELLAGHPPAAVRRRLLAFAVDRPAADLQSALERRLDRSAAELTRLLPLVRGLPVATASPMLEKLCTHSDAGLRRLALRALAQTDVRADVVERWLRRALRDPQRSVASEAVARLAELGSPKALEILADYVACRLDRVESVPALGRRAAAGLLRHGDDGRGLLLAAFRRVLNRIAPRKIAMALAVASVLETQRGDAEVARALRRFRWSLTGLARWPAALSRRGRRR